MVFGILNLISLMILYFVRNKNKEVLKGCICLGILCINIALCLTIIITKQYESENIALFISIIISVFMLIGMYQKIKDVRDIMFVVVIITLIYSVSTVTRYSFLKDEDETGPEIVQISHVYSEVGRVVIGEKLANGYVYEGHAFSLKAEEGSSSSFEVIKGRPFVFAESIYMFDEGSSDLIKYEVLEVRDPESIKREDIRMIIKEDSYLMPARFHTD